MESGTPPLPITEDIVLYFLSQLAAQRRSRLFFKVTHNLSEDRPWHFWCAPDLDLLEVLPDDTVIAYEVKGQRKRKQGLEWPAVFEGLDQALAYLDLPLVTDDVRNVRMFDGGAVDFVYLVHASAGRDVLDVRKRRIIALTPIGFLAAFPDRGQGIGHTSDMPGRAAPQHERLVEIVVPKPNPLHDPGAEAFLLEHLSSLKAFGEKGRSYRLRVEKAGHAFFGLKA